MGTVRTGRLLRHTLLEVAVARYELGVRGDDIRMPSTQ
jgi:hypothetical protein